MNWLDGRSAAGLGANFRRVIHLDPGFPVRLQALHHGDARARTGHLSGLRQSRFLFGGELSALRLDRAARALDHSRRERRQYRQEERNDHTMMLAVLGCSALGACYGAITATGALWKTLAGTGYGGLGLLLGVPVAFVINMTRHLGR
jgi:hypothetical protein